jgi:membrane-associated phospholipid phosphatase
MTSAVAVDIDLYRWFEGLAQDTPWLQPGVLVYTNLGLTLFAVLMVVAWRWARHQPGAVMASALWAPVAVLVAYGLSNVAKVVFREPRPCHALPRVLTVGPCDYVTDYSFPSNHAVVAASAAVALLIVHRRLGVVAVVLTVAIGLSRVYIGAHYPHDVLAGFVLGAGVAVAGLFVRPGLAELVDRHRHSGPEWLLGPPTRHPVASG